MGVIFILIGSGIWVKTGTTKASFWSKFLKAMRKEKLEAANLIRALTSPKGASKIVEILKLIARIDNKIHKDESQFISAFAKSWNIPYKEENFEEDSLDSNEHYNYVQLHQLVIDYLSIKPPKEQVRELRDVIAALVEIDSELSEQEVILMDEVFAIFDSYFDNDQEAKMYRVVVAPNNTQHKEKILNLHPQTKLSDIRGGESFEVGRYFSIRYARKVCKHYREMNFFAALEFPESRA